MLNVRRPLALRAVALAAAVAVAAGASACSAAPGTTRSTGSPPPSGTTTSTKPTDPVAWAAQLCAAVHEAVRATAAVSTEIPPAQPLRDDTLPLWQARLGTTIAGMSAAVEAVGRDVDAAPAGGDVSGDARRLANVLTAAFEGSGLWLSRVVGAGDAAVARRGMASAGTVAAEIHSAAVTLATTLEEASTGPFAAAAACRATSAGPPTTAIPSGG